MEEAMPTTSKSKVEKVNPRITLGEGDAKGLKGKTVGDTCEILIKGEVVEVRAPSEWEKKEGKKEISYTIEVTKINNYGSRRV